MTEKEKMLNGQLYSTMDQEIRDLQQKAKALTYEYNMTRPDEGEKRHSILQELFGECSPLTFIEPSFRCDFGFNIYTEGLTVVNYNCVMLDTSEIRIGANAFIGPGTCLACAGHPLIPEERNQGFVVSKPITLEKDVWIGANCTVVGGVTIGEGSMIGAGSVVTRDIPAGVVAAGNPCRVIRKVTEADKVL
ncbi:MAG: sugar O-acetyltransferase [bacterium]|nr:sugar O-acetyltransferase [bacterium]